MSDPEVVNAAETEFIEHNNDIESEYVELSYTVETESIELDNAVVTDSIADDKPIILPCDTYASKGLYKVHIAKQNTAFIFFLMVPFCFLLIAVMVNSGLLKTFSCIVIISMWVVSYYMLDTPFSLRGLQDNLSSEGQLYFYTEIVREKPCGDSRSWDGICASMITFFEVRGIPNGLYNGRDCQELFFYLTEEPDLSEVRKVPSGKRKKSKTPDSTTPESKTPESKTPDSKTPDLDEGTQYAYTGGSNDSTDCPIPAGVVDSHQRDILLIAKRCAVETFYKAEMEGWVHDYPEFANDLIETSWQKI